MSIFLIFIPISTTKSRLLPPGKKRLNYFVTLKSFRLFNQRTRKILPGTQLPFHNLL